MNTNAEPNATPTRAWLEEHMAWVHRVAMKLHRDFGLARAEVELDDVVQFGYVGLLEARERFDAKRGTEFRLYAHRRIHGAILDGLRSMTRLPRRAHQLLRLAALAQDDDMQVGAQLEAALDAGRLFSRSGFLIFHSPYPAELAHHSSSPEELAHEKRRAERVISLVDELAEPDRSIARRRLFEGESLASIAKDLGISRPWAWRVLERACRNATLGALGDEQ